VTDAAEELPRTLVTMGKPRYSLRSSLIALTLFACGVAAVIWFMRTYGPVTINDATGELANNVLRGYTTIPANATDVSVQYTPNSSATIKFRFSERGTRAWCEANGWEIVRDDTSRYGTRFEFVTPRGGGSWYDGRIWFVLVSD